MGDFSEIGRAGRRAMTVRVPRHWHDHHVQGRGVLPAVEAMQLLAGWVRRYRDDVPVHTIAEARFDKFLPLTAESDALAVFFDLSDRGHGAVSASLATIIKAKSAKMSRTVTHARLTFTGAGPGPDLADDKISPAPLSKAGLFEVAPQQIYESLVPLGPAYRNIKAPLQLTPKGAFAQIFVPDYGIGATDLALGSPFAADAAFHAACVWSQRFEGIVAFPVAIDRRIIHRPTCGGDLYHAHVTPVKRDGATLIFDIRIGAAGGRAFETLQGVRMRDVSGGRLQPPAWIGL